MWLSGFNVKKYIIKFLCPDFLGVFCPLLNMIKLLVFNFIHVFFLILFSFFVERNSERRYVWLSLDYIRWKNGLVLTLSIVF